MSFPRIPNGYASMADAAILEQGYYNWQRISTNTSVFTTPLPGMTVFKDALDDYQSCVNAALSGDRILVGQKNVARQNVIKMLHRLGYYVLMTADGDRQIILDSGFPMSKDGTPIVLVKPTGVQVVNGDQPGELLVSVNKVKGARSYMYEYSTDPLLSDESWKIMNCTTTKCKLTGLVPGTTYYIRVGAVGARDQVLYSDIVSKKAA